MALVKCQHPNCVLCDQGIPKVGYYYLEMLDPITHLGTGKFMRIKVGSALDGFIRNDPAFKEVLADIDNVFS